MRAPVLQTCIFCGAPELTCFFQAKNAEGDSGLVALREESVAPYGAPDLLPWLPALTHWANFCRASGAEYGRGAEPGG